MGQINEKKDDGVSVFSSHKKYVHLASSINPSLILNIARSASSLTLQYGGGANRAEDICCRMCNACGVERVDVSAVTTSITIAISIGGHNYSTLVRVNGRGVNLSKLNMVNDISRSLSNGTMTPTCAMETLREIENTNLEASRFLPFAAGFSSAFFTLLLGGGLCEFVLSLFCGTLISYVIAFFEKSGVYSFINNLFGGIIAAAIAIISSFLLGFIHIKADVTPIIIGAMMPLLPGLAMTNAIRDTISGDYVSGGASALEALTMAIALAAGAALTFGVFMRIGVRV